jgi:hypothetical protein
MIETLSFPVERFESGMYLPVKAKSATSESRILRVLIHDIKLLN